MRELRLLTGFILLLFATTVAAFPSDKTVTMDFKDISLEKFIYEMKRQTGLDILYNAQSIKEVNHVNVKAVDEQWATVLKRVLTPCNFTYAIKNNIVVIRKIKEGDIKKKLIGKVVDDQGEELIGATVCIKKKDGKLAYTITDTDGKFSYECSENEFTVNITYIGCDKLVQNVNLKNKTNYSFKLKSSSNVLDELVCTGYQTVDKRKLTSSIFSISEKDLDFKGAVTVDQMLEGKIPGLLTMTNSTTPGASSKMRMRGATTFTGSREPLWVIDGIIYENPVPLSADEINSWDNINLIGNAITGLNPQDIARIDVLKDASATAIYGTRAANGVIVVTTKVGKAGKTSINYSFNAQVQRRPKYSDYELMTSKERIDVSREIMDKGLYFQNTPERYGYEGVMMDYWDKKISFDEFQQQVSSMEANNTDWFGALYRTSLSQTHNVSFSGGDVNNKYYFSVGYNDDKGTEKGTDLKRLTARMNLSSHLRENMTLDVRLNGSNQDANYNPGNYSAFNEAYYTNRIFPIYNQDGSLHYVQKYINTDQTTQKKIYGNYNILNEFNNGGNKVNNKSLNLTAVLNWEIIENLRYSTTLGLTTTTNQTENWMGEKSFYAAQLRGYDYGQDPPRSDYISLLPEGGVWANSSVNQHSYVWRNQVNYNFDLLKKHHFNIDLGYEISSVKYRGQASGQCPGYSQEQGESFIPIWAKNEQEAASYYWYLRYWFMGQGDVSAITFPTITDRKDNKMSVYMTSTYTYRNLFSLNLNLRNDGSNRFGQYESEKFNPVWSVSGRLNLNEFGLMDVESIDMLAFRTSYGYRGSVPNTSPYLIISTPKKNSVSGELSSNINAYPNSNLKWEKTSTINAGFDFSFLKGRVTGAIEGYYSKSTDLISMRSASLVNGTSTMMYNDGTAQNKGIELSLATVNIDTRDFKWRTSLSFSHNKNSIKQGSVEDNSYMDYINGTVIREGSSIDGFFSYKFDGLDEHGLPRFKGLTGNASNLTKDEFLNNIFTYSGTRTPTSFGSFSTEFSYKNLSLRAEFSYKLGYSLRLLQLYQDGNNSLPMPEDNMNKTFVNRWRNPGDEAYTSVPGLSNVDLSFPEAVIPVGAAEAYKYTMVDLAYRTIAAPTSYSGWFMYNYSDERVAKGNHIRFRSLTLGYTLPGNLLKSVGVSGVRLDFQAQNLGVLAFDKKLKGQDPDQVSSLGMPTLPTYNFSINVSF